MLTRSTKTVDREVNSQVYAIVGEDAVGTTWCCAKEKKGRRRRKLSRSLAQKIAVPGNLTEEDENIRGDQASLEGKREGKKIDIVEVELGKEARLVALLG